MKDGLAGPNKPPCHPKKEREAAEPVRALEPPPYHSLDCLMHPTPDPPRSLFLFPRSLSKTPNLIVHRQTRRPSLSIRRQANLHVHIGECRCLPIAARN